MLGEKKMKEEEFYKGEFGSNFGPQVKPLPTAPKNVEEYETRANSTLKEHNRRIVKDDYYKLMKSALIGLGIFCGILLYLLYGGYMTDEIEIPPCPNISIPSCPDAPACNCPSCPICNCPACHNMCDYPDEISITITNQTG